MAVLGARRGQRAREGVARGSHNEKGLQVLQALLL